MGLPASLQAANPLPRCQERIKCRGTYSRDSSIPTSSTRTLFFPSRTFRESLPGSSGPAALLAHGLASDCAPADSLRLHFSRYADHVGIHFVLCNKLRQFPYEDIEFFLPQLCHLIISVNNESMALEEFLLDLCEESVTAALLVRP